MHGWVGDGAGGVDIGGDFGLGGREGEDGGAEGDGANVVGVAGGGDSLAGVAELGGGGWVEFCQDYEGESPKDGVGIVGHGICGVVVCVLVAGEGDPQVGRG